MDLAIGIVIWLLILSGVVLWVSIAVVVWKLIYGKLDKRYWLRYNMRTLFVTATIIAVAAGIMATGHRLGVSKTVIRAMEREYMQSSVEQ